MPREGTSGESRSHPREGTTKIGAYPSRAPGRTFGGCPGISRVGQSWQSCGVVGRLASLGVIAVLTGVGCVTRVYTSLAVIDIEDGHFVLREKRPSISFDDLQAVTGAELHVKGDVADLIVPQI